MKTFSAITLKLNLFLNEMGMNKEINANYLFTTYTTGSIK